MSRNLICREFEVSLKRQHTTFVMDVWKGIWRRKLLLSFWRGKTLSRIKIRALKLIWLRPWINLEFFYAGFDVVRVFSFHHIIFALRHLFQRGSAIFGALKRPFLLQVSCALRQRRGRIKRAAPTVIYAENSVVYCIDRVFKNAVWGMRTEIPSSLEFPMGIFPSKINLNFCHIFLLLDWKEISDAAVVQPIFSREHFIRKHLPLNQACVGEETFLICSGTAQFPRKFARPPHACQGHFSTRKKPRAARL